MKAVKEILKKEDQDIFYILILFHLGFSLEFCCEEMSSWTIWEPSFYQVKRWNSLVVLGIDMSKFGAFFRRVTV